MTITAKLHRADGALTTLSNGRHVWQADVDRVSGSNDAAPGPHDLLDSTLAACTAPRLELYIRRRHWEVTDLEVTIEHVEECDAQGKTIYKLRRRIHIEGEIAEADRQRLMDVAGKCPTHRVLEGDLSIETEAA
jgi:putative redox protein